MGLKRENISTGLDIGSSAIKSVELKFAKDTIELTGFGLEPVQEDLISSLKKVSVKGPINTSVSGASTVIRCIDFPRMSEDELKQAMKFEVQKYIPFGINDVNLDSYILKEKPLDNKLLVLVAAAKKEFVNQRLKLIQEAGLRVNIVDLDSLALANAFNFNYPKDSGEGLKNKTTAILNIGASISNLNIMEEGLPVLSRDIYIAGNNLTQRIQDTFGVDFQSAEELKFNMDKDKEKSGKISVMAEQVLSDLAKELRVSFDYYESQSASFVAKIFLSGGGSKFLGLKDKLANLLTIEVDYWDPLRRLTIADGVDKEKMGKVSNELAVSVGLALRK